MTSEQKFLATLVYTFNAMPPQGKAGVLADAGLASMTEEEVTALVFRAGLLIGSQK